MDDDSAAPTSLLMWLGYRAAEDRIVSAIAEAGFGDLTRAQIRLLAGIDDDEGGIFLHVAGWQGTVAPEG